MSHIQKPSRIDENTLILNNPYNIPVRIYANETLKLEIEAVDELLEMLELQTTVDNMKTIDFVSKNSGIVSVVVTPDFHKGAGIPIGTVSLTRGVVVPQAIGNDVNCGMRLYVTSLKVDDVKKNLDTLETRMRHAFFEGGRNIPMSKNQREEMLKEGLFGLLNTREEAKNQGLWKYYNPKVQEKEIEYVNSYGSLPTDKIFGLQDYLGKDGLSRDSQIGSIGGATILLNCNL